MQFAIHNHRRANPRADDDQDHIAHTASRAKVKFAEGRGFGIVLEQDR